jgi:hypothetical protein
VRPFGWPQNGPGPWPSNALSDEPAKKRLFELSALSDTFEFIRFQVSLQEVPDAPVISSNGLGRPRLTSIAIRREWLTSVALITLSISFPA